MAKLPAAECTAPALKRNPTTDESRMPKGLPDNPHAAIERFDACRPPLVGRALEVFITLKPSFVAPQKPGYPAHAWGLADNARRNRGDHSHTAAQPGYAFPNDRRHLSACVPDPAAGRLMRVVENNPFRVVTRGLVLGEPVHWWVTRNHRIPATQGNE